MVSIVCICKYMYVIYIYGEYSVYVCLCLIHTLTGLGLLIVNILKAVS